MIIVTIVNAIVRLLLPLELVLPLREQQQLLLLLLLMMLLLLLLLLRCYYCHYYRDTFPLVRWKSLNKGQGGCNVFDGRHQVLDHGCYEV